MTCPKPDLPPSFEALLDEVHQCNLCAPYLPHGVRPVLQIHPQARILIAGQAPGRKVHNSGVPFDDASGDRLRNWMGISKEQFYNPRLVAILPMGLCFPGSTQSGDKPPREECAPALRATLLNSMKHLQLSLIIGKYAQAYHLTSQAKTLTATVQQWRNYWPEKLPMPHPSPRNNRWLRNNPWFEEKVLPELKARVSKILAH